MPPPSTPAPKFLFKRPGSTQQQARQSQHTPISTPQFITPRAPSSQVPIRPDIIFTQTQRRPKYNDDIESSPVSSPGASPGKRGREIQSIDDVEDEDEQEAREPVTYQSDGSVDDNSVVEDSQELKSPERKRRRVSISPGLGRSPEVIPSSPMQDVLFPDSPDSQVKTEEQDLPNIESPFLDEVGDVEDPSADLPQTPSSASSSVDLTQRERRTLPSAAPRFKVRSPKQDNSSDAAEEIRQPTFHRPPRFILPEVEAQVLEGLPPAFSPQRRGAKYVPGGLAAELQGWLSHIKGSKGEGTSMRVKVDEVRPGGGRMYLVRGRILSPVGDEQNPGSDVRVMLAGEGQLTGLSTKAPLREGSIAVIGDPVWDIDIGADEDGGRWVVGCDWKVEL